jgi:quinoprotein dehydrogenase-associated probable ABC transporter substrate-binding protein
MATNSNLLLRAWRASFLLTAVIGHPSSGSAVEHRDATSPLKICADPNNLPFSDVHGAGFENRLAQLVGQELGRPVLYSWWAQRRGFIRNTLNAGDCDAIMGVPTRLDMLATTRPYYRSGYVFVSRADRGYALSSMTDARLRNLSVGVQLIGNDGFNTPPAHALGDQGIVKNVVGFTVYGDYRESSPAARIVNAVEDGTIDIAAVWGPLAGYFAKLSPTRLAIAPIRNTEQFAPLAFEYDIGVGVRKQDQQLRAEIDDVIARRQDDIKRLLDRYGVPLLSAPGPGQAQYPNRPAK